MASEVAVAVIGAVSGVVGGGITAIAAPWATWGIEKRRSRRQRRVELIAEWRAGIDELRAAEDSAAPQLSYPGGSMVVSTGAPDPPDTKDTRQNWYETLSPHLSKDAHESLKTLRGKNVADRGRQIPDLLRAEVARIERDWKLI